MTAVAAATTVAFLAPTPASAAKPPSGSPSGAPAAGGSFNEALYTLINQARTAAGLQALAHSAPLGLIAEDAPYAGCGFNVAGRAADMGTRNYLGSGILGCGTQTVENMVAAAGIPFLSLGENVGFASGTTDASVAASYVYNTWMANSSYRDRLLDPASTQVGVGSWQSNGGKKWLGGYSKVFVTSAVFVRSGPNVSTSPSTMAFGGYAVNTTSAPQNLTVTSTGTTAASVSSVTATPPFAVAANGCGGPLASGSSCTVGVTFTPTARTSYGGTLTLATSAGTRTVALSGHGQLPSAATVSATSLAFGSQEAGYTSGSRLVTLSSSGEGTLSVADLSVSGPFSITTNGCNGTSRAPGLSCVVGIAFSPTAAGSASGSLTIPTNAGTRTVSLSGTGVAVTRTQATVPGSIAADCSVDVTAALQAWIDSVPDSAVLHFGANACYRIDGTLIVQGHNNITLDGHGATFKAVTDGTETSNPRARSQWKFVLGTNIVVKNMTTVGANPNAGLSDAAYNVNLEAQHNYHLSGVDNFVLDGVQGSDGYGDFVYVGPYRVTPAVLSKHVTIRNSHFERNGRQGIAVTGAEDVLIENNFIGEVRRSVIDIEPNDPDNAIRRITFRANQVGAFRLKFVANVGNANAPHEDIHIVTNTFQGAPSYMSSTLGNINGVVRTGYKFIGNVAQDDHGGPGGSVIGAVNIDDLEIRGNVQPVQRDRDMHMTRVTNVTNLSVTGNTLRWGVASIYLDGGNSNYCASGNMIGDPLTLETTSYPCV